MEDENKLICRFINEGVTLVIEDSSARIHLERDEENGPLLERVASMLWKNEEMNQALSLVDEALYIDDYGDYSISSGDDGYKAVKAVQAAIIKKEVE